MLVVCFDGCNIKLLVANSDKIDRYPDVSTNKRSRVISITNTFTGFACVFIPFIAKTKVKISNGLADFAWETRLGVTACVQS